MWKRLDRLLMDVSRVAMLIVALDLAHDVASLVLGNSETIWPSDKLESEI